MNLDSLLRYVAYISSPHLDLGVWLSDIIASIETEAEKILEEARRRAQLVVEEAKAEAERILSDEAYRAQIEELKSSLEEKLRVEIQEIISAAEIEVRKLSSTSEEVLLRLAKRVASKIAGIEIE